MTDEQNAEATEQTMEEIAGNIPETDKPVEKLADSKPDNVKDFQEFFDKQSKTNEDLQSKVETISKAHDELVNSQHLETVNKEIKGIAENLSEKTGVNAEYVEYSLEKMYNNDPNFKKVWENRKENPESLKQALGIAEKEIAAKAQNLIDPQIAENQRALMASQTTGGRVQQESMDDKYAAMPDGEFLSTVRKMNRA